MEVLRKELALPADLWGGLLEVLRETHAQVCVARTQGTPLAIAGGVRQGDPASPLLFSLLLDRASAFLEEQAPTYTRVRCPLLPTLMATAMLLFADDIVLLGDCPERL